jgi:LmbE family N-acetylglucosaminyl deacetylase
MSPTSPGLEAATSADAPDRLRRAVTEGAGCLFLSPHLDDAVLSCGSLISALVEVCPVTVVTLFSAAGPSPHTRAARAYLRQCSAPDAAALYHARRAEDRAVLARLGVTAVQLDIPDALFRRRRTGKPPVGRLGALIPELGHCYPTFRFDIARGRIAHADRALIHQLGGQLDLLVDASDAHLVFCPIGVGRHVDHLIARTLGERHAAQVVHYSDFPYNRSSAPDPTYIAAHALLPWTWTPGAAEKAALIRGYATQVDALFPDGTIPAGPETYFAPVRGSRRPAGRLGQAHG